MGSINIGIPDPDIPPGGGGTLSDMETESPNNATRGMEFGTVVRFIGLRTRGRYVNMKRKGFLL